MNAALLSEAERILRLHDPADFDASLTAFPESIEYVRQVEDTEAWKTGYGSVEEFYAAHEARHPDIRVYGAVRREIETADPLTHPGGPASQRIARMVAQSPSTPVKSGDVRKHEDALRRHGRDPRATRSKLNPP